MGTEGDRMFFVFPQGAGRARLYLNYGQDSAARFAGPRKVENFLDAFHLACLPGSDEIARSRPVGPIACYPSLNSWTDEPFTDAVVLAGDEAGMCDNILGTGLANAMRDARTITDLLLSSADWSRELFAPFGEERRGRMKRMHLCANLMAKLFAEFDDEARARRRRTFDLMSSNPAYAAFMQVALNGPEAIPDERFIAYLSNRLLEEEPVGV
jgi:2-polyprenyl-6-methoxyphenol hydroxylase-like FAD-dependent oxidoreductase